MHALWFMDSRFDVPFQISQKMLNPYTANNAFYDVLKVWRIKIS